MNGTPKPRGNISQMRRRRRAIIDLDIRIWNTARLDAIKPVLLVLRHLGFGYAIEGHIKRSIALTANFKFAALADKHFAFGANVFSAAIDVVWIRRRPQQLLVN